MYSLTLRISLSVCEDVVGRECSAGEGGQAFVGWELVGRGCAPLPASVGHILHSTGCTSEVGRAG